MSTTTLHGGRQARLLDESGEGWYHVYNRVACEKDRMLFEECEGAREMLMRFIDFYTKAYCCEVATYVVMGNHYHLVIKMDSVCSLSREELKKKAELFYPNTFDQTNRWNEDHWAQFEKRLFSLADVMRNIQQGFARWFNKANKRRGRFWADRFKSTILYGEEALLECMQYVDLNPIRAGLVELPEDYAYGAFYKRVRGEDQELIDLRPLLNIRTKKASFEEYRSMVYARGSIVTKENTAAIQEEIIDQEVAQNFDLGLATERRDHLRFYVDGLVIGAKDKIEAWLSRLREEGYYKRRKNPVCLNEKLGWFALREQRSHFEGH